MQDLRTLRDLAGLTQHQAAKAAGIARSRLSEAECGEVELSAEEETAVRGFLLEAIRDRATRMEGVLDSAKSDPVTA